MDYHYNWRGKYKVGKESSFSYLMRKALRRLLKGRYDNVKGLVGNRGI